jgi:hypothetical protein
MATIVHENGTGKLTLEKLESGIFLVRVTFRQCERMPKQDGFDMLTALGAFYETTRECFVQVFDFETTYVPDLDLILATIALMRTSSAIFESYLLHSGVVAREHVDALRQRMRSWTTTRPVYYLQTADDIHNVEPPRV